MHDLLKTNGVKQVYIYKTFFPEGIIQKLYPASNEIFFLLTCCCLITLLLDTDGYNHKSTLQDANTLSFFLWEVFCSLWSNFKTGNKILIKGRCFYICNMRAFKIKGKQKPHHQKNHFLQNTSSSAALPIPKANAGMLQFQVKSCKAEKCWKRQPCLPCKAKTSTKYEKVHYRVWPVMVISKESWIPEIKYPKMFPQIHADCIQRLTDIQQRTHFWCSAQIQMR